MSFQSRLKSFAGNFFETYRNAKYARYYNNLEINHKVILYDSYFGRGMLCNPYAIFMELINDQNFKNYTHVWVMEDRTANEPVFHQIKNNKNVLMIRRHSDDHLKYLASAGYIVANVSLPLYYCKKPGQIYVNTWHGTPVKSLGYDMPDAAATISNVLRNFLSADYILSANPFLTSIYLEKYKLSGLYEGKIIEEGYPRNDRIFHADNSSLLSLLSQYGVDYDEKKQLILYAPTWKGSDYDHPQVNINEYIQFKQTIEQSIDTEKYQILLKPHQVVYKELKKSGVFDNALIPAFIDTNELLSLTDILISDYSSIFYDFLSSRKPVIFYIPDLKEYKNYRGLYVQPEDLPGPSLTSLKDVSEVINNLDEVVKRYQDKYEKARQFACPYEDGNVSSRIVDIIWNKNNISPDGRPYNIISCQNQKKKLMFFGGGLRMNGISTALRTMLDYVDYDKYDVTVFAGKLQYEDSKEFICTFNKNVRAFASVSKTPATFTEIMRSDILRIFGFHFPLMKYIYPKKMYHREFLRCFGESHFDTVADYSGYGSFYSILLLSAADSKKLIWQHNDLFSDKKKKIGLKKPHSRELRVVFSTYDFYDKIVGCSEDIMRINLENIGYRHLKNKCSFVRNAVAFDRVIAGASRSFSPDSAIRAGFPELFDSSLISFVNMGRLSPEKNQIALIHAFSKLYDENRNVRLYIIGEGILMGEMKTLITSLGLENKVILTGNMENPFMLMKECDCFVLPSLYEGQPVSILEARVLKLPIIMSEFSSSASSIIPEGQLLIGNTVEEIYKGLCMFMQKKVPVTDFDYKEYNDTTIKQLEEIV